MSVCVHACMRVYVCACICINGCVWGGIGDGEAEQYSLKNLGNFNTEQTLTKAILATQLFLLKYLNTENLKG